jgi:hypothetical protein
MTTLLEIFDNAHYLPESFFWPPLRCSLGSNPSVAALVRPVVLMVVAIA